MVRYQWYPSFYIILVAPPGVATKTTTVSTAMNFLRQIPGIHFGPDIVTWESLVCELAKVTENFEYKTDFMPMSAITLEAGELGNLIDPQNKDMMNLYVKLWDGAPKIEKSTKTSGCDMVEAPWVNLIGCTTPSWIADSMPQHAIGGGFVSRCIFVYAQEKEKYIAYVDEHVSDFDDKLQQDLLDDLTHMASTLIGPFTIDKEARDWGRSWYERMWKLAAKESNDALRDGYISRKQGHLHKTAMIISACRSDNMIITEEDLQISDQMLLTIEPDMAKVFSRVGKSEESNRVDQFLGYIKMKKEVTYESAYTQVHSYFTNFRDFEGILSGCIRSGKIRLEQRAAIMWLIWTGD